MGRSEAISRCYWAFLGHSEAILWLSRPSFGHPGSTLRHLRATDPEDGRCIVDLAKFAPRLHESGICCFPGRNLWPLESILVSCLNRLDASLGHFATSRSNIGSCSFALASLLAVFDLHRRRSSSFSTICSLPTREYRFVVGLMPSCDDRVESSCGDLEVLSKKPVVLVVYFASSLCFVFERPIMYRCFLSSCEINAPSCSRL